jgi:hypothetical protein
MAMKEPHTRVVAAEPQNRVAVGMDQHCVTPHRDGWWACRIVVRVASRIFLGACYHLESVSVKMEGVFLRAVRYAVTRLKLQRTPSSLLFKIISTVSFPCRTKELVWLPYITGLLE